MQSMGVCWIAVYAILEEAGMEVHRVNARETKNLPGRKTDVQQSQWLMKLHRYVLLRNRFARRKEIRILRTYWRWAVADGSVNSIRWRKEVFRDRDRN